MLKKMEAVDYKNPALYINRELSQLEFNWRVLAQAKDDAMPLLERLRFPVYFQHQHGRVLRNPRRRIDGAIGAAGSQARAGQPLAQEVITAVGARAHDLVAEQYRVLNEALIPELQQAGICFIRRGEWSTLQGVWLRDYFEKEVLPMLSPAGA